MYLIECTWHEWWKHVVWLALRSKAQQVADKEDTKADLHKETIVVTMFPEILTKLGCSALEEVRVADLDEDMLAGDEALLLDGYGTAQGNLKGIKRESREFSSSANIAELFRKSKG